MDRLAREGVRFAMRQRSAADRPRARRAATGLYPARIGVRDNATTPMQTR
jgi:hypothetical protein